MTDETLNKKLDEVSSSDILDSLKTGAELYTTITESFVTEFVFYDKTLYEWAEYLSISIPSPKDLDINSFRELLVQLSKY